jgi:hypothetical protein
MMRTAIIDACGKMLMRSSILFRFFAIFPYQMGVQPCYNPIEIESKPTRRFFANLEPRGRAIFLEEPPRWQSPMTAARL